MNYGKCVNCLPRGNVSASAMDLLVKEEAGKSPEKGWNFFFF